jgi:hypothetical protein
LILVLFSFLSAPIKKKKKNGVTYKNGRADLDEQCRQRTDAAVP